MMLSRVRGEFEAYDINFDLDVNHPELASVEAHIRTASVNTRDAKRDDHLRSPDFFKSEEHPEMIFKSTRVEQTGKKTGRLHGDLTILGVTRPVVLDVTYLGETKSPWGAVSVGFEASTRINREDWGLTWNVALEAGGWLVSKEVTINLEVEFIAQPESVAEPSAAAALRRGEATGAHSIEPAGVAVN